MSKEGKVRLDLYLVAKGLFESREAARRQIKSGKVRVDGEPVTKPGVLIAESSEVEVEEEPLQYVSRGGLKLKKAIDTFNIDPKGMIAMDIGASTGGFTDCLLQHGASKVYAIDVGSGQLAERLRNDPRVISFEGTNIRYLSRDMIKEAVDIFTIDVSFISVTKFFFRIPEFIKEGSTGIVLIKPQFEAGRERVGKKGIVKDPKVHADVIKDLTGHFSLLDFSVKGLTYSPVMGGDGNIEYLAYIKYEPNYNGSEGVEESFVEFIVKEAQDALRGQ